MTVLRCQAHMAFVSVQIKVNKLSTDYGFVFKTLSESSAYDNTHIDYKNKPHLTFKSFAKVDVSSIRRNVEQQDVTIVCAWKIRNYEYKLDGL